MVKPKKLERGGHGATFSSDLDVSDGALQELTSAECLRQHPYGPLDLRGTQSTDVGATQAAKAASHVFRAGRPPALSSFAFTRYALQHPTPWWVEFGGTPTPRRGLVVAWLDASRPALRAPRWSSAALTT